MFIRTPRHQKWVVVWRSYGLRSAQAVEQLAARVRAGAADVGADPTVVMHLSMLRALVSAGATGCDAGLQHCAGEIGVIAGVPRQHPAGGGADVGAVQAGANALADVLDHVLAEARVGAGAADLGTGDTGVDTPGQPGLVDAP